jgi:probable HAF family extracellular repeat protein
MSKFLGVEAMFRRWVILLGVVSFLVSTSAEDAWGVIQYTVTDLGALPGSSEGRGNCISNNGQVAGYCNYRSTNYPRAFCYSNGVMRDLGLLSGGSFSRAWGINDRGQVVGEATDSISGVSAFLYSNGTMTSLLPLLHSNFSSCWAFDINNSGLVVGESGSGFIYNSNTGMTTWLPGGGFTHPWGINDNGQVVGYVYDTTSQAYHAFLYNKGTMNDLGTFVGGSGSFAYDLNENNQVVGYAYTPSGVGHAFLYSNNTMTDLGTLPGSSWSYGEGINDKGQVVGESSVAGVLGYHAFLYSNGTMSDLNDLINPTSGWTLQFAQDINNNGWIVGQGVNSNGQYRAFLLKPIPEPSTLALLLTATFGGLLLWRRRR